MFTWDPLCGCDEDTEGEDDHDRAPVVHPVDAALWMRFAELVLVQDGQMLANAGEDSHDSRHDEGFSALVYFAKTSLSL